MIRKRTQTSVTRSSFRKRSELTNNIDDITSVPDLIDKIWRKPQDLFTPGEKGLNNGYCSFALTSSLINLPSARPWVLAMTSFITAPISFADLAPDS